MLNKRRSFGTRKVSPPQPTCMTDDQKATYLKSLRNDRPTRPTGSRPLPSRPSISKLNHGTLVSNEEDQFQVRNSNCSSLPNSDSLGSIKGRSLVMAPNGDPIGRKVTPPEVRYRESTLRQKEKLEAQSLRHALEQMDFQNEEERIHQAAQLEAADLVWKHRNPESAEQEKTAPYRNPDLAKKPYVIRDNRSVLDQQHKRISTRNVSNSSDESSCDVVVPLRFSKHPSVVVHKQELSNAETSNRRRSSGKRNTSSGSSKGIFRNPDDQIYEETSQPESKIRQDHAVDRHLRSRNHNPSIRGSRPLPQKPCASIEKVNDHSSRSRALQRKFTPDPPSRSQTPEDTGFTRDRVLEIRSEEIRAATSMKRSDRSPNLPIPTAVSDKPGRPIVSFNPAWKPTRISAAEPANNEHPKSRSQPTITLPSNPTGGGSESSAPINGQSWKTTPEANALTTIPVVNVCNDENITIPDSQAQLSTTPVIPILSPDMEISNSRNLTASEDVPSFQIESERKHARPLPSITFETDSAHGISANGSVAKPSMELPVNNFAVKHRMPWLSRQSDASPMHTARSATVTCSACGLPISGRIVTASGASDKLKARFHSKCFTCFHCCTRLECVSFYPEPESSRLERLGLNDDENSSNNIHSTYDNADLRFFCHLDYHDLFSPRCASCHTPIEGAVIVAAGKSWHEGHFFCAECGDPFSSSSPFVESQGYAYCVGCHTRRTSARCKACKKQILDDITVEALGGKWHEECFRCDDCGAGFGDDGKFFVREVEVELTEKEKRKGLNYRKVEERAVCGGCEARRLKSKDVVAFL